MATYVYKGEGKRHYLYPNFTVEPGQTVEAEKNPDPHRFELVKPPAKPKMKEV